MTQEFFNEISQTKPVEILTPEQFACIDNPDQFQYIVSASKIKNRQETIKMIDEAGVDLITVIHDTAVLGKTPAPSIGPGSFVFNFATVSIGATLGRHCIVDCYSLIGHHCTLGDNCLVCPNVMINGKSSLGTNCVCNTGVTVTNRAAVADDIELLAFTKVTKNLHAPGRYIGSTAKKFNSLASPNEL
jgi:UDP-3-O-[3-hydroxymyristoyl] glucosamine N-acyltransferase